MAGTIRLAVVSDIHYASAAEQARGSDYELRGIPNPLTRLFIRCLRHFFWLREPLGQNHLLDTFLSRAGSPDLVIANGDYSCDTAFVGVSDDATCESAKLCLDRLRNHFPGRLYATIGDHELGKFNIVGARGGMRLRSYLRCREELALERFWRLDAGRHVLIGVASSLVAFPILELETPPEEREQWWKLREEHLDEIRSAFAAVPRDRRVLLFCHDPTALPFLESEETVRAKFAQIEQTIIGHLHSDLIYWKSRVLAGFPVIRFCGNTVRRLSTAVNQARRWRPFNVRLCPSLAGIEIGPRGGFLTLELDSRGELPIRVHCHRLPRSRFSGAAARQGEH